MSALYSLMILALLPLAALAGAAGDGQSDCKALGGRMQDDVACSEVDINDTFCLVGSDAALPCAGLFAHVRKCNTLGRPALDPFHCAARCGPDGTARGDECECVSDSADRDARCEWKPAMVALCKAAEKGDFAAATTAVTAVANVSARACARFEATPLHRAAWGGHLSVVTLLAGAGATVNAVQRDGQTPLHLAVVNAGRRSVRGPTIVNYLLDNRADPDAQDNNGATPLLAGLEVDAAFIVRAAIQALLARGANVTLANNRGLAPLHRAATRRFSAERYSRLLLTLGADVNQRGPNGLTPLHIAALRDDPGLAGALLENGANVHAQNNAGQTPIQLAPSPGSRVRPVLIAKGSCLESQEWNPETMRCADRSSP